MPFAPTGIYTPPTGAENAAPGQVIRSATWNSIFTDEAVALTQLGQLTWVQNPRTITTPGSFTVNTTDNAIFVAANPGTIFLLAASLMLGPVKILGAASTIFGGATAVVLPSGTDKISNAGTLTLSSNYQVATFWPIPGTIGGGYVVSYS